MVKASADMLYLLANQKGTTRYARYSLSVTQS